MLYACNPQYILIYQAESKIAELETNLSTNLLPRKEELEAIKDSVLSDSLQAEYESKQKELNEAVAAVEESAQELKSEHFLDLLQVLQSKV